MIYDSIDQLITQLKADLSEAQLKNNKICARHPEVFMLDEKGNFIAKKGLPLRYTLREVEKV